MSKHSYYILLLFCSTMVSRCSKDNNKTDVQKDAAPLIKSYSYSSTNGVNYSYSYTYDDKKRQSTTTDNLGNITSYTYFQGRVVATGYAADKTIRNLFTYYLDENNYAGVGTSISDPGKFIVYEINDNGQISNQTDNINGFFLQFKSFLNTNGTIDSLVMYKSGVWYQTQVFQEYDLSKTMTINNANKGIGFLGHTTNHPFSKVIFRLPGSPVTENRFEYKYDAQNRIIEKKQIGVSNTNTETFSYD